MAEYTKGVTLTSAPIGTPAFGARKDLPADLAGGDQKLAPVQFDSAGALRVNPEGGRTTVSFSLSNVALHATAHNFFTLGGSASATIKLVRLEVAVEGTAADAEVALNKQSAADTGGTPVTATLVPHDTGNLPTAVPGDIICQGYTADPTAGTLVGALRTAKLEVQAAGTAAVTAVWEFGKDGRQPPTLRGVAQQLALALPGVTITNGKATISGEIVIEPLTA